jgi:class 3 adenylate cyclase/tetratricopeptide (TPR) repeat protein
MFPAIAGSASSMKCTSCGHESGEGARFCVQCGTLLELHCPSCTAVVQLEHRFCPGCGSKLPWAEDVEKTPAEQPHEDDHTGERRQVTVLFGDLTGFTNLSSTLDPEETHALLNRYFETVDGIVRNYGGAIDKHIGDAVMAVFGAPVAHTDDPQRAMRAAIDIHSALTAMEPPLTAHIGIASGTVVASDTGSTEHREYTVIGDSVNLAARLQDRARPGETLVTGAVREAGGAGFRYDQIGDVEIKGLADPVFVWRLIDLASDESSEGRLPFVGRRAELAQFTGALDACRTNGSGQSLLLRGEPGIGKTRLLEEYHRLSEERSFGWHSGLILDFGAGKGLDAIAAIVSALLGIPAGADKATKSDAISSSIDDGVVSNEQQVFLNDLLDIPQPTELRSDYDAMDDDTRTQGKEQVVTELVRKVAAESPIVIAIEDIHWADSATLSHMARLADTCAGCPAVMVMTSRIEGDPIDATWRAATAGAPLTTVDLGPLRPEEAIAFASDYFEATERFARTCVERSGGNPLFLEQLLRVAEEASESEVPGTIQSIVLARMDNLEPADRQALQAASVLGQRFSLDALRHVIGDAEYGCRALVEHFLVRPLGQGFLFAHALVRDGVYSSLLKARRTALHQRAADWFESRDLSLRAEHLDRAEDPGAAAAYLAAADDESRNYRNGSALGLSERGLALADGAMAYEIGCFRGDLLRGVGEVGLSIASFENALAKATNDIERSRAWIGMAEGFRASDRHEEAREALDNAEQLGTNGPPLALAEIHHLRGNLYFPAGRARECFEQHEIALEFARRGGSREWEARALGGLGDGSYLAGRMRTACENFRKCVALCQELGLGRIEVANRHMVGWSRMYLNEVAAAGEDAHAAAEMAVRVGQNRAEMIARLLISLVNVECCDLEVAREEGEKGIALARRLGASHFVAQGLCWLAKIAVAERRREEARQYIDEAIGIVRDVGLGFFGPLALGTAARLAEDAALRASLLKEAEAALEKGCVSHNYFWFYREAIDAALEKAQWSEAERYCLALERYASDEPLPWSSLFVARGRALARFGRGERGTDLAAELNRVASVAKNAELTAHLQPIAAALDSI